MSCWILHDCTVPFPLANTQTAATVLNMEEYEKKYSHTKIKIKNNKEKNCDIDNKKLYRTIIIIILTPIHTKNIHRLRKRYI